jgi:hypothetical protein
MTKPKAFTIVKKYLNGNTPLIPKDKAMPAEWVKLQLRATKRGITINAFPKIYCLADNVDFMGLSDVNHWEPL